MRVSWEREVEELNRRHAWAEELGGRDNIDKLHNQGRQTVRERIEQLADAGSFHEVGKLAGNAVLEDGELKRVVPAPYVMGLARIDGREVCIGGEDFTIRGGASWSGARSKGGQSGFVEDLAYEYRIPLINLLDGAGGSVTSAQRRGYSVLPGAHGFERNVDLMDTVPVIGAVLGSAAGGPAARAVLTHFSVMVKGTSHVFVAGPSIAERGLGEDIDKEGLGGHKVAVDIAGTVDNAVDSEAESFEQIRRFLSYMPQNVHELPPEIASDDPADRAEEELLSIVPQERRRPYEMRRLLELVVDKDSSFEVQPTFGRAVYTILARMSGRPVGVIAHNPAYYGGAVDPKSARKQTRFIRLCDIFHIPIVFFVDTPGFLVGRKAEEEGMIRDGVDSMAALLKARVPVLTVIVRKCYGIAGTVPFDKNGVDFQVAWPSAEWGSLPIEGGVAVAFRREIAAAADPKKREAELEKELRELASPFLTAQAFAVEDVIDPRLTRPLLCRFLDAAQNRLRADFG
tara:strand:+ start:10609 stop:12150 length:1542 start_codon:yes stop_codon:yes gene_type:complete